MTTKLFNAKIETPCPHCASPRLGLDYDDDYLIIAGTLGPEEPVTCRHREHVETPSLEGSYPAASL